MQQDDFYKAYVRGLLLSAPTFLVAEGSEGGANLVARLSSEVHLVFVNY